MIFSLISWLLNDSSNSIAIEANFSSLEIRVSWTNSDKEIRCFATNNESFDYGIKAISKSGKYIVVGIPEEEDFIKINPHKLRIKEVDILNVRRSNVKFNRMQNIIVKNSIPIDKLVTHYFKIDDIQEGFDIASDYKNKIIRGIVY